MIKKLLSASMFINMAIAMENKITVIAINPERNPELFFETLEERVIDQVGKARFACNNCDSIAMTTHLTNITLLLEKLLVNQKYLVDGYPHKGPEATNAKRKAIFQSDTCKSYFFTHSFKDQTNSLLKMLEPDNNNQILTEEWLIMQELFKQFEPVDLLKKTKSDPNN